jgi:methylglyoxal synthase
MPVVTMERCKRIALNAHDNRKGDLLGWGALEERPAGR